MNFSSMLSFEKYFCQIYYTALTTLPTTIFCGDFLEDLALPWWWGVQKHHNVLHRVVWCTMFWKGNKCIAYTWALSITLGVKIYYGITTLYCVKNVVIWIFKLRFVVSSKSLESLVVCGTRNQTQSPWNLLVLDAGKLNCKLIYQSKHNHPFNRTLSSKNLAQVLRKVAEITKKAFAV